ncbi:MAG TPA: nucleoside monophosphate kinase [Chloroflexota bacterium]|nr:nucleoside monophosphate kinase [Chloroflexota bacterium]
MILLLLGAPGSGKGTQGRRLSEHFKIPYLASGDLLREAMGKDTSFGRQVSEYIERGLYVPDEIVVPPLIAELDRVQREGGGAVLDGFPRTREQAEVLDRSLGERSSGIDRVLLLEVPRDVLLPRLAGRRVCRSCNASYHVQTKPPKVDAICDVCGGEVYQRVDDKPDMVDDRLRVYFERTWPLVAYYKGKQRLAQIDGNRPESDVTAALIRAADGQPVG